MQQMLLTCAEQGMVPMGLGSISPPVLFFFLGAFAALVRSNLSVPRPVTKLLSLYLLWAIGFKGGAEIAHGSLGAEVLWVIALAMGLCSVVPMWVYLFLRRLVDAPNAAAVASCYGSVSVVTFLTACTALDQSGTPHSGHMVAVMALMESPAIIIALVALHLDERRKAGGAGRESGSRRGMLAVLHESTLNGPVVLLLGSLFVGILTGERGYDTFKPLCTDAFPGILAFFLLDLGILAARRVRLVMRVPPVLLTIAIVAPLVNACLAIAGCAAIGVSEGDAVLLAVLAASASYIAAPATLRIAVPRADPAIYIALALGVTFPFNIIVGIPLYHAMVRWVM